MSEKIYSAVIIDENCELSFEEFCHTIRVEDNIVVEMVEHRLICPRGKQQQDWRFDSECLRRAKKAVSFKHDLEINYPGISLALDLLDEIDSLQKQLSTLKKLTE